MERKEELVQLRAFARQDGVLIAALWIASFALVVAAPALALGPLLAFSTPLVVGWRVCRYRDDTLGGVISFRRSYFYSAHCFLYASAIFALAQYLYLRFLDGGAFVQMMTDGVNALEPAYEQSGVSIEELRQALAQLQSLSPINWAFMIMMQNFFIGFIASFPIAAFCARKVAVKRDSQK